MGNEASTPQKAYRQSLTKEEYGQMLSAEKERGRRLSLSKTKQKPPEYLGDVTLYPDKAYTKAELESIYANLTGRLEALHKHITDLGRNEGEGFRREYETIAEGRDATSLASKLPVHRELNRYQNIVAFDHSRVKLRPNEHTMNTDYINANYVHGYKHPNMYIACQGPVPKSMAAFWQMVWENKSEVVVMVTNEVEGDPPRLKCHRYWPEPEQDGQRAVAQYGMYQVEQVANSADPGYITRHFKLTDKKSGQTRDVTHYLYAAWPDHGVPDTGREMLQFRKVVRNRYNSANPMVVHCSAGVGRTGTFIGLDRYLDSCADLDDSMSLLDIVRDMRAARNFMVQALGQFVYLHNTALEGLAVLIQKVERELSMMSQPTDRNRGDQLLDELERDLGSAHARFQQRINRARRGSFQDPSMQIKPDLKKENVGLNTRYTDDIGATQRTTQEQRMGSLAASVNGWLDRQNVPMGAEEHGYVSDRSAPLTSRLMALSDARALWMTRYTDAERTWQAESDMEGVMYDVGNQLTPLESRVSSLAASEEAWRLKSGSNMTAADYKARQEILELTNRLQSLQFTVLNSEKRWRSKGDGMSERNEEPDDSKGVHTDDQFGGLMSRLELLQTHVSSWSNRSTWVNYDIDKFHAEITSVAKEQERLANARSKEAADKLAKDEAAKKAARDLAKAKSDAIAAEKAEKKRRDDIRAKMKKKSMPDFSYDHPTVIAKQKAEEDARKQKELDKQMKELLKEEEKKQKQEQKEAKQAKAKAKANKFIKSQSGSKK